MEGVFVVSNFVDRTGMKYGRLTVIGISIKRKYGVIYWDCVCECGNIKTVESSALISGRTKSCGCLRKEIYKNPPHRQSYDEVKKIFSDQGCELLEDNFKNSDQLLLYRCSCGNISKTRLRTFKDGHRCKKCALEINRLKNSGSNNALWDPNKTNEERIIQRKYEAYHKWRSTVIERDGSCIVCGTRHGLQVHHLDSYSQNRDKRLEVSNGVSLCYGCHKKFHSRYGKYGNTKEQFKEFMDGLKPYERVPVRPRYNPISSKSVFLTYNGKKQTVTQWANELNICRHVIYERLKRGWSHDKIITTPVDKRYAHRKSQ